MAYNFDVNIKTEHFLIEVDTAAKYGYFEHLHLGDTCGGGLWFDATDVSGPSGHTLLELSDYDGVFELPKEVCEALEMDMRGFKVPDTFWPDEPVKITKQPETNTEFVTRLMEFSPYGALTQVFIMDALYKQADVAIAAKVSDWPDPFPFSQEAWKETAKYILQQLEIKNEKKI
jgi:hypothetical protein